MKMVQRKVSNKLSIQQPIQTETEKSHVTPNPTLQNYDVKIKVGELKSKRMKKSRSDIEFNLGSPVRTPTPNKPLSGNKQAVKPTTLVTPSPRKPLPVNKSWAYGSPNYMKGTSSSEARKERPTSASSTTLELGRVGKSSSFKKVRTLTTKSPSFKHTRPGTHNKNKIVLCQRPTCSSTLKDSKFPSYLKLTPAATEAQGSSAIKVCPYHYCSLNGHRHAVAPPFKSFLSSRRRMLKTQKIVKPEAFEIKVIQVDSKMSFLLSSALEIPQDQKDDFFVEIHVPRHDSNLSETIHNQACFECYDHGMDSDSSVSLDQVFGEVSDMEWEQGENTEIHDGVPVDKASGDDEREAGIELDKFLAEKLLPYIHDEIMECLLFSDADTVSDNQSSMTEYDIEEQIVDNEIICSTELKDESIQEKIVDNEIICSTELKDESIEEQIVDNEIICSTELKDESIEEQIVYSEIICSTELKDESIEEQDGDFSNPFEKVTEASNGELDSIHEPKETDGELDGGLYVCKETKDVVMEEIEVELSETRNNEDESLSITAEEQFETEAKKTTNETSTNTNQEQNSKVNLHSFEDHAVQVTALQTEDSNLIEDEAAIRKECQKVYKGISGKGIDSTDELCNKLKRAARCRKSDEENEDAREFNPRPPNFLPLEPEQDAEKVDLRHQDMEERRNAQEWMIDHALQKTVNQLAIARKRKVALLVEAFESVLPIPKYDPQMRGDSSTFSQARRIQACR